MKPANTKRTPERVITVRGTPFRVFPAEMRDGRCERVESSKNWDELAVLSPSGEPLAFAYEYGATWVGRRLNRDRTERGGFSICGRTLESILEQV